MPFADCLTWLPPRARGPASLLLLASLAVLSAALGGVPGLLSFSLALPAAVLAIAALTERRLQRGAVPVASSPRALVVATLDRALRSGPGRSTCALAIEIDGFRDLEAEHDRPALDHLLRVLIDRLRTALREGDLALRLDGPTFAVALAPSRDLGLEPALQLAGRLQRSLGEAVALPDGTTIPVGVSLGLALSARLATPTGEALLQGATRALIEAQRSGPGAIRSYSEAMRARVESRCHLAAAVAEAIDLGEVQAYFQPQVSARTGSVTGFEALARWQHPTRGLLPPSEFLPAIEQAGLMGRLGERMLAAALAALRSWEAQSLYVPSVGVNFSNAELCDPQIVDRIAWELDRFDLTPDRLVIEVLETVVASRADDAVIRNLAGLARLGCCLDLDDFGTGQASISSIRRFSIERIKIDRSFVTRLDEDPEQARMVGAILGMAERLGLDTLAEGVETEGEHRMLARLGCGHVQGFGIARPMPFEETGPWLRAWMDGRGAAPTRRLRAV